MLRPNIPHANLIKQAELLIPRLEKLTPDSSWAHRASGCRRALLRLAKCLEADRYPAPQTRAADLENLQKAIDQSFDILNRAAKERIT